MKLSNKKLIAGAVLSALGAVIAQPAMALVAATSILDIDNFNFFQANTTTNLIPDVDITIIGSFTNTGALKADYNGTTSSSGPVSQAGDVDLAQLCQGPDCAVYGENDYLTLPAAPPVNSFASADMELTGSSLIAPGANANSRADSGLLTDAFASSNADVGLISNFSFINNNLTGLDVSFDAHAFVMVYTDPTDGAGSQAEATTSWSITFSEVGGGTQVFTPNELNLNLKNDPTTAGLFGALRTDSFGAPGGSLPVLINVALNVGSTYNVTIDHNSLETTNLKVVPIPEPGVLGLMGLGLIGLGALKKRKRVV